MRRRFGAPVLVCTALGVVLWAQSAYAQQDQATATALFRKGLGDMMAGRYDTGCPALAESQRYDPRPGTLFTLAECENKAGRVASAVTHYKDYLRLFATMTAALQEKQKGRELISAQQAAALQPRVPKLTIDLPPNAPAGTVVKRDGVVLDASSLGSPVPVDPGDHVVSAEPPGGGPAYETRFRIEIAEQKRVVAELGPPGPSGEAAQEPVAPESAGDGSTLRTVGLVVGGVGLAALVVGAITGGLAMSENNTAKDNCNGTVCNQDGLDAIDRTRPLGNASTACFVVGGVGLAAGVLMFALAPSAGTEAGPETVGRGLRPWVGSTTAFDAVIGLQGAW